MSKAHVFKCAIRKILKSVSHFPSKLVTVQLPIVLIHMNSLDVVPNSVAQVAAAIEEKLSNQGPSRLPTHPPNVLPNAAHPNSSVTSLVPSSPHPDQLASLARRPSVAHSIQGRAFAAPRMQSLDRMRADVDDVQKNLQQLTHALDTSPRKYGHIKHNVDAKPNKNPTATQRKFQYGAGPGPANGTSTIRRVQSNLDYAYHTPPSNRKGRVLGDSDLGAFREQLRHVQSNETNRSTASKSSRPGQPNNPAHKAAPSASSGSIFAAKEVHRVPSTRVPSRLGAASATRFREAELAPGISGEQLELGAVRTAESFRQRLEQAREQQFQFKKKKSLEKWAWWDRKDRDKEKGKALSNWI